MDSIVCTVELDVNPYASGRWPYVPVKTLGWATPVKTHRDPKLTEGEISATVNEPRVHRPQVPRLLEMKIK
jgi:hypothetical protein